MMIKILDRYLFTQLFVAILIVMATLTALDGLFAFIQELDDIGRGSYGHVQALLYILLTIPNRIYQYAPTAVLIGGLLSLGGLAAQGELIALRAAGLSVRQIAFAVLKGGFVFVALIFALGEFVAPNASDQANTLRTEAMSGKAAVQSGASVWFKKQHDFIQTEGIIHNSHMLSLSIYRFDGLRLAEIIHAEQANRNERGWLLQNVSRLLIAEDGVTTETLLTEQWDEIVDEKMLDVLSIDPDDMAANNLNHYINYLDANGLDDSRYKLAFWNRFVQPLSSLVMLLVALPFVFGSQRTGGAGQRLFIGILLGIGYFLFSRLINQVGVVYGVPPFISATAPVAAFLVLGLALLQRVR
ncbi:MAG: LPS export ABC transporter permease LptG [Thiotrichales bacterium]